MNNFSARYYKFKKRFNNIIKYSARSFVPIVFNSILSLLIIRLYNPALWGEIVTYLIIFNLGTVLITWGSKQYLLREFSLNPNSLSSKWLENLISRIPLFIIFSIIIFIIHIPSSIKIGMIVWQLFYFINRSYEVIILFRKKFTFFLVIELFIAIIFLLIVAFENFIIDVLFIVLLFSFFEVCRLIISLFYFRHEFRKKIPLHFNPKILLASLSFFLLGLIGLLQSRFDIYCTAYLLTPEKLAAYQVLINFLILIQAGTGFIIQPYLKEIYRLPLKSVKRLSFRFTLLGVVGAVPIIVIVYFILSKIYMLKFGWDMVLLSYLYIVPIFYYSIRVYLIYRDKKESFILFSGAIILLISFPVNVYLIQNFELIGAISAGTITQWLTLFSYIYFEKKFQLV